MSDERDPCILYYRRRESERRASHFAEEEQCAAEEALSAAGYDVICRYGDDEFAGPFCGHLEPRPSWALALQAAERHVVGRPDHKCTVIVLRADGIGSGDPFLPRKEDLQKYPGLNFRVCGFAPRKHALDTSLRSAHNYWQRFIDMEREMHRGTLIPLGETSLCNEIILRSDPYKQVKRAYYANRGEVPLSLKLQLYRSPVAREVNWPCLVNQEEIEIPPKSAMYVSSFIQGDPHFAHEWWDVRIGQKRQRQVGNCLITPDRLSEDTLPLNWWYFTPKGLGADDFLWENAPAIETDHLKFRNWSPDDAREYAIALNNDQVMRFLGGVQSPQEIEDDLQYFASEGEAGPTFWALETKGEGRLVGFCGLLKVDELDSPVDGMWEIGWRLALDGQGQGYGVEAASAVLKNAFDVWGFDAIVSRIHTDNHSSRKLAERLGMYERVATRHTPHGEDDALLVYQIDKERFYQIGQTPPALEGRI